LRDSPSQPEMLSPSGSLGFVVGKESPRRSKSSAAAWKLAKPLPEARRWLPQALACWWLSSLYLPHYRFLWKWTDRLAVNVQKSRGRGRRKAGLRQKRRAFSFSNRALLNFEKLKAEECDDFDTLGVCAPAAAAGRCLDRTEAKRRTTAAGSPKGERSESIDRIGGFFDRITESERSGERLPWAARRVSIANQFAGGTGWGTGMFGFEPFEGAGGWRETNLFRFRGLAQMIPAS